MNISDKVKAVIADKLGKEVSEVKDNASFINDLGADSLDTVELIMELEKEFSITISDEDATKMTTVGDAIKYIDAHLKSVEGKPTGKTVEMKPGAKAA